MNMGLVFRHAVARRPERTALVDPAAGVRYTYEEWYDRCVEVASALESYGIGEGDLIATAMRNRVETSTLYCATQLLGAVFVPSKYRLSADELTYLVDNIDPDILFFSEEVEDVIDTTIDRTETEFDLVAVDSEHPAAVGYDEFVADANTDGFTPTFVEPERTSVVLHTSGTTGDPKGVPRSHENTYAAGMAHAIQTGWVQGERTLGMMSLSHTMGIHSLAAILLLSGKLAIQRRFSVEKILGLVESERLTSLYLTPTVFHHLFDSDAVESADFSSVERISYAGSSMTPTTISAIEEHVDPDQFVNHYGSTEIYTHTVYDTAAEKLNCLGRAGINTSVRVVELKEFDQLDPDTTVETGELGEIIVDASSPEAFDGYFNAVEEKALADGWFFTGDLGYRDDDGDLFLVGRVDDMIISGAENIYPVEVEQVLERHDAVDEAAVVGRPSERWNQTVAAFVTLNVDPSEVDFGTAADALDEHCLQSDELADYKRPRKYLFIDEFSKSYVGKILRNELQKRDLDIEVHSEVEI